MVMFNSYVKLQEGTRVIRELFSLLEQVAARSQSLISRGYQRLIRAGFCGASKWL